MSGTNASLRHTDFPPNANGGLFACGRGAILRGGVGRRRTGRAVELDDPRGADPAEQRPPAILDPTDPLFVGGFASHHAGGAQFCFADGSVNFISEAVDPLTFRRLGDRADGAMISSEDF